MLWGSGTKIMRKVRKGYIGYMKMGPKPTEIQEKAPSE